MIINQCCLLIDDDPDSQEIFNEAMSDVSPGTICFNSPGGFDALYMMMEENIRPSYIFLKMDLPEMTAAQFLIIIKKIAGLKDIPVIVHGNKIKPHQINELKESGAFAIYYRPLEYSGVRNMLSLYFGPAIANTQPN